ncbi:hypothetical protein HK098_005970, partial [Nowakowskiella sp. JEL0407]
MANKSWWIHPRTKVSFGDSYFFNESHVTVPRSQPLLRKSNEDDDTTDILPKRKIQRRNSQHSTSTESTTTTQTPTQPPQLDSKNNTKTAETIKANVKHGQKAQNEFDELYRSTFKPFLETVVSEFKSSWGDGFSSGGGDVCETAVTGENQEIDFVEFGKMTYL